MQRTTAMQDEVYIAFHTTLLDTLDQRNGEGYTPKFWDMVLQNDHIVNRVCNYMSPPFTHCEIAFKRKNGFQSYGFKTDKFDTYNGDYLHRAGFCLLRIKIPWFQMNFIQSLLRKFMEHKDEMYTSQFKMSLVGGKFRQYMCMGPCKYPTIDQKAWTCSEFVAYVLQQAGILDSSSIHPSYASPTNVFYELLDCQGLDVQGSFNIHCNNNYEDPNITYENTNAYYLYCKLMDVRDPVQLSRVKREFMEGSLCKKFKVKTGDINQYSIGKIIGDPNFDLYSYLERGTLDHDLVTEDKKEKENLINSLPIAPTRKMESFTGIDMGGVGGINGTNTYTRKRYNEGSHNVSIPLYG